MKRALLLLMVSVLFLGGCVYTKFEKEGVKVTYFRAGTNVDNLEGRVGDSTIKIGKSRIDIKAFQAIIDALSVAP